MTYIKWRPLGGGGGDIQIDVTPILDGNDGRLLYQDGNLLSETVGIHSNGNRLGIGYGGAGSIGAQLDIKAEGVNDLVFRIMNESGTDYVASIANESIGFKNSFAEMLIGEYEIAPSVFLDWAGLLSGDFGIGIVDLTPIGGGKEVGLGSYVSGSKINIKDNIIDIEGVTDINIDSGGNVNIDSGGNVNIDSGGTAHIKGVSNVDIDSGENVNIYTSDRFQVFDEYFNLVHFLSADKKTSLSRPSQIELGVIEASVDSGGMRELGFYGESPIKQPNIADTSSSTISLGTGNELTDDTTFDGYTIGQIVRGLRDLGLFN